MATDDNSTTGRRANLAPRSATGKSRITALDGLRAVALLIIMGYHFGVGWLQGGFFALDIFYVLSGYLITGLLLSEFRRRGRIKLSAFWLRRARRLLPALLVVLVVVTLMVRFALPAGTYPDFRMDSLSALFYFSNWWQIVASSNYFVASGPVSPLVHTWSLALEEQFYLIWPLVVLVVMFAGRTFVRGVRSLLVVSVVGTIGSALEMALLYRPTANLTRLYFGTDTHAQSILVGSVMACTMTLVQMRRGEDGMAPVARSRPGQVALAALGVAGLGGTFVLTYFETGTAAFDYRGGFLLSALSAAAIIIGAICVPRGPLAAVLAFRPLVWLGLISYGAYLWHYPVFIFLDGSRTGLDGLALLAVRFAATFVLAALSFYLVERPVMYGTYWRSLRSVVPAMAAVLVTTVVVVAGTAVGAAGGLAAGGLASGVTRPVDATGSNYGIPVLLVGDSTALTLGIALGNSQEEARYDANVIDVGLEGCGIAEGTTIDADGSLVSTYPACDTKAPTDQQWPALLARHLRQYQPKVVVLLAGYWESFDRTDPAGSMTNILQPAYQRYIQAQLQKFVSIASAGGRQVVLLTAPYYDSPELANGQLPPQDDPARVREYNRLVEAVGQANPDTVSVVDLNQIVSPGGHYAATIGNLTVRAPDGVHFVYNLPYQNVPDTQAQEAALAKWLDPQIMPEIMAAARR